MTPLLWIAHIFINTFGITQPTPETRNRMALLIGALLLAVLVGLAAAALVLRNMFHA